MTTINDGHKHDIRIDMGKAKCIICGHTKEEIADPIHAPLSSLGTASAVAPSVPPITALQLQEFLMSDKDELTLFIRIKDNKPEVTFKGMWDGKWLKAAVKGIEREYKVIRHNTTRMQVKREADKKRSLENLSAVVNN